jgi:hypothetical protein
MRELRALGGPRTEPAQLAPLRDRTRTPRPLSADAHRTAAFHDLGTSSWRADKTGRRDPGLHTWCMLISLGNRGDEHGNRAQPQHKKRPKSPFEQGQNVGSKPPLRPKIPWSVQTKLQVDGRLHDLAMFDVAIEVTGNGERLPFSKPRFPERTLTTR